MRKEAHLKVCIALAAAAACPVSMAAAKPSIEVQRDGRVSISGRDVSCKRNIRTILDPRLPNLGIATRNLLVMNPALLNRQPDTVRLFVYHHECGHHHVGGDELGADCWAVHAGVEAGWLEARGLPEICRSFGNAPETDTHPASARRCRALRVCFDKAVATVRARSKPEVKLVRAPSLVHEGYLSR